MNDATGSNLPESAKLSPRGCEPDKRRAFWAEEPVETARASAVEPPQRNTRVHLKGVVSHLGRIAVLSALASCGGEGPSSASGTSSADSTGTSPAGSSSGAAGSSEPAAIDETGDESTDVTSTSGGSRSDVTGSETSSLDASSGSGSSGESDCMGELCHEDQACAPEGCAFPCEGVHVPGDYATIQEASNALEAVGEPATICVAPGNYPQPLMLGNNLTLIGASPALVTLGDVFPLGTTTIRGVTLDQLSATTQSGANVRVEASVMSSAEAQPPATPGSGDIVLFIDGCIVHGDSARPAIRGHVNDAAGMAGVSLTVQNSWIEGGRIGIDAGGADEWINIVIRNNTFTGNTTGIFIWNNFDPGFTPGTDLSATVINNVIVGSQTAVRFDETTAETYSNNALFDNVTNYAGMAVPSGVSVTDDPMLDDEAPPAPMPGSPLIDAGTADDAPEADFWGAPRVTTDIGAVEGP